MNKRILGTSLLMLFLAANPAVPQAPPAQPQQTAPQQPALPQPAGALAALPPGPMVGDLQLNDAPLRTVIDQLARQLKINVQIDSKVEGTVTLNTYGQPAAIDARNLLDFLLRINNAGMIQEGDIYRIVPLGDLVRQPIAQVTNGKEIPEDERTMLNMVFLKYVTVSEVSKILTEFADEHTVIKSYPPANLLFILDSRRDMKRLMELIDLFDNDLFAAQRVRLFEVENTRPSELVKLLDSVLKSLSLNSSTSTVHFLPIDQLNMLIATAPNPGVFDVVETWIKKLDVPVTSTSAVIDTYVYNVNYGRADCLAQALTQLYYMQSGGGMYGNNAYGGGYGGYGNSNGYGGGGYNQGGYGVGSNAYAGQYGNSGGMGGAGGLGTGGGYGSQNSFAGGFGGSGSCQTVGSGGMGMGMGGAGYGGGGINGAGGSYGYPSFGGYNAQVPVQTLGAAGAGAGTQAAPGTSVTGAPAVDPGPPPPKIVANPLANSLLIQGNTQQYQSILKLLKELDRPPRQILLEAKVYSVAMTGSFSAGVQTQFLAATGGGDRRATGSIIGAATNLQAGFLVGQSRQLLAFLNMSENRGNVTVVSEPSLIATDSIPASINVGTQVPTLTGTISAFGGATGAVSSQGISSHNTGATLQVNARVNPSGVVTLIIDQEISKAVPPDSDSTIQTPSFDQQVVQTQITLHDGDTIAIGGIMTETNQRATSGFPFLSRIPYLGALFGTQSYSKDRSEMILFMTPHVIYDTTDLMEASDELKSRVKKLRRYLP